MNDRPTPETDYLAISCYIDSVIEGVFALRAVPIEDCRKLERERNELRELVKAYQDYTQLLGDEINDTAAVAYLHGWRSSRYEQGKVLREKIKQLEVAK